MKVRDLTFNEKKLLSNEWICGTLASLMRDSIFQKWKVRYNLEDDDVSFFVIEGLKNLNGFNMGRTAFERVCAAARILES